MYNVISTRKFWYELFVMTIGMLIGAIAVHFILIPSKLIIGSISGLSVVIYALTDIPVSAVTFIINGFLLILAYLLIGKEFGIKTVYTALILSPWLYFLEKFFPVTESMMQDPWLDLLCFVVILSFVQVTLFSINASTGGLDILGKIINKYLHIDIGTSITVAGVIICCTAFSINDFKMVVIGLVATWINGLVINHFTSGMNMKKRVCIISRDSERIKDFIINKLHRGASLYKLQGGFSGENFVEVVAILARDEFAALMKFIDKNKISTFMSAGSVNEIYGTWNKGRKIRPLQNTKKEIYSKKD